MVFDGCNFNSESKGCRIKTKEPIKVLFNRCIFNCYNDFEGYTIANFMFWDSNNNVGSAIITFDSCSLANYRNRICNVNNGVITFRNCNIGNTGENVAFSSMLLGSGNKVYMFNCQGDGIEFGSAASKWEFEDVYDKSLTPIYYKKKRAFLMEGDSVTFDIRRFPIPIHELVNRIHVVPINNYEPFNVTITNDSSHIIVTMHNNGSTPIEYEISYDFTKFRGEENVISITTTGAPIKSENFQFDGTKNYIIRCISNPDLSQSYKRVILGLLNEEGSIVKGIYIPLSGEEVVYARDSSSTIVAALINFNAYHTAGEYKFELFFVE